MSDELNVIQTAIQSGDKRGARRLLKPLLAAHPSAEIWWMAACASESQEQEITCLRRALKLDGKHAAARARYAELKRMAHDEMMPSLTELVDELPPLELLTEFPEPQRSRTRVDIYAIKASNQRKKRRRWTTLGCGGSILMSLSMGYFAMTVLGSPISSQIRQFLSGEAPVASSNGRPIFGKVDPTSESHPGLPANIEVVAPDSIEPTLSDGPRPTPDNNPLTYADDAAAAGFAVEASKSTPLSQGGTSTDVLDPGFAHEYTFSTTTGDEFAIAIQFFSPTAISIDTNVAILDSDGVNAESHCERETIFIDGSGTAFVCQVHKGGTWKLQVFGRENQSTGVYVVTYERM